jgi:outer membrane autotransporter protein
LSAPAIITYADGVNAVEAKINAHVEGYGGAFSNATLNIENGAGGAIAAYGSGSHAVHFSAYNYALGSDGGEGGAVLSEFAGNITNYGAVYSKYGRAITGSSLARATNNFYTSYTGEDASAAAVMYVFNHNLIEAPNDDAVNIDDRAIANAIDGDTSSTARITIYNTVGAVISSGENGIDAYAHADARSYSYDGHGNANAQLIIRNSGTITAADDAVYGVADAFARGENYAYAAASVAMNNVTGGEGSGSGGNITSYFGDGILVGAEARSALTSFSAIGTSYAHSDVSIVSDDTIVAAGDGIDTWSYAYARGGSGGHSADAYATMYVHNTGTITSGAGGKGIYAQGYARSYDVPYARSRSKVLVNNSASITAGTGNTSDAAGIFAYSEARAYGEDSGYAAAKSTVINSGTIKVFGSDAKGIYSGAYAYAGAFNFGNATTSSSPMFGAEGLIFNSGTVKTYGDSSAGILALAIGYTRAQTTSEAYAYSLVVNSGAVSTLGTGSPGVSSIALAYADGAEGQFEVVDPHAAAYATLTNSGAITTVGNSSIGVFVFGGAAAGEHNNGSEDVVVAESYAYAHNSGAITTGNGNGSTGAYSPALVVLSGAVANLGDSGYFSADILGSLGAGIGEALGSSNFDISNFEGTGSYYATADATAIVVNSGSLATTGRFGIGIAGGAIAYSYGYGNYSTARAVANITNSGTITTQGTYAAGIVGLSLALSASYTGGEGGNASASLEITNSSTITTHGRNASGIFALAVASSDNNYGTGTASIHVTTSGTVTATGAGSDGILALAIGQTSSSITIDVNGGTVSGGTVTTGGDILATGGPGLQTMSLGFGSSFLGNLSFGGYGAGIEAFGDGPITLNNHGTIGALSDVAVDLYAFDPGVFGNLSGSGSGNVVIVNNTDGKIIGLVNAYGKNTTFDNKGTWVVRGGSNGVQPSVASGHSATYGYSFIEGQGTGVVTNETGASVLIVGNQEIDLTTFNNSGLISLAERDTGPYETGHPGAGVFETLVIGGDYVSSGGKLAVDVDLHSGEHDFVVINGSVSGTTGVEVVPTGSGTPLETTGDGIPIVQVKGAINSGTEDFSLIGSPDANSHTLVSGVIKYDLNLVANNGAGGTWFLQSEPVFDFGNINAGILAAFGMANSAFGDLLSNMPASDIQGAQNGPYPKLASADDGFIPGRPSEVGKLGFWGRFVGDSLDVSPHNQPAPFNVNLSLGQFGVDYTLAAGNGGALMIGGFGGYANSNLDFDASAASASMRGGVYGAYGLFTMGQWEGGVLASIGDNTMRYHDPSTGTAFQVSPSTWGISGLLATRFDFDEGIFVQPRLEYSFARVDGFHFVDSTLVNVKVSSTESSVGILGVRAGKTFMTNDGVTWAPYIDLAVTDEFAGTTAVSGGGFTLQTELSGVNGKFGGGVNFTLMNRISLFARADYVTGRTEQGVKGFVGMRYVPTF